MRTRQHRLGQRTPPAGIKAAPIARSGENSVANIMSSSINEVCQWWPSSRRPSPWLLATRYTIERIDFGNMIKLGASRLLFCAENTMVF